MKTETINRAGYELAHSAKRATFTIPAGQWDPVAALGTAPGQAVEAALASSPDNCWQTGYCPGYGWRASIRGNQCTVRKYA